MDLRLIYHQSCWNLDAEIINRELISIQSFAGRCFRDVGD